MSYCLRRAWQEGYGAFTVSASRRMALTSSDRKSIIEDGTFVRFDQRRSRPTDHAWNLRRGRRHDQCEWPLLAKTRFPGLRKTAFARSAAGVFARKHTPRELWLGLPPRNPGRKDNGDAISPPARRRTMRASRLLTPRRGWLELLPRRAAASPPGRRGAEIRDRRCLPRPCPGEKQE